MKFSMKITYAMLCVSIAAYAPLYAAYAGWGAKLASASSAYKAAVPGWIKNTNDALTSATAKVKAATTTAALRAAVQGVVLPSTTGKSSDAALTPSNLLAAADQAAFKTMGTNLSNLVAAVKAQAGLVTTDVAADVAALKTKAAGFAGVIATAADQQSFGVTAGINALVVTAAPAASSTTSTDRSLVTTMADTTLAKKVVDAVVAKITSSKNDIAKNGVTNTSCSTISCVTDRFTPLKTSLMTAATAALGSAANAGALTLDQATPLVKQMTDALIALIDYIESISVSRTLPSLTSPNYSSSDKTTFKADATAILAQVKSIAAKLSSFTLDLDGAGAWTTVTAKIANFTPRA